MFEESASDGSGAPSVGLDGGIAMSSRAESSDWTGSSGSSGSSEMGAASAMGATVMAAWRARDPDWKTLVEVAQASGPDPAFVDVADTELDHQVRVRAVQLAADTCCWLEVLAEHVVRGIWAEQGGRTPAQWLSWKIGMAAPTAREYVRVGLQLRELPLLRQQFRAGRISYSKVRALTRVAVPELEEMLLQWAEDATANEIERVVSGFRRAQRAATSSDEDRHLRRGWSERVEDDGMVAVTLRMTADEAAEMRSLCDRLVELERHAIRRDEDDPDDTGDQAVNAAPLAEIPGTVEGEDADGHPGAESDDPFTGPVGTAAASEGNLRSTGGEVIDAVLRTLRCGVQTGPSDTSGFDRHTLVLHLDAADLVDDAAPGVVVDDAHGRTQVVERQLVRRLACEAGLVAVVRDGEHTPIDVGRRDRRLSAALRRALTSRDRSCRFPGCGSSRHLDAHHVVHWADGGETNLSNLVLLCGYHHRFVHDRGWTVTAAASGTFAFAPPRGAPVPRTGWDPDAMEVPSPPFGHGPDRSSAGDRAAVEDADSLAPDGWPGPGCADIDLTVAVLQQEFRRHLPRELAAA